MQFQQWIFKRIHQNQYPVEWFGSLDCVRNTFWNLRRSFEIWVKFEFINERERKRHRRKERETYNIQCELWKSNSYNRIWNVNSYWQTQNMTNKLNDSRLCINRRCYWPLKMKNDRCLCSCCCCGCSNRFYRSSYLKIEPHFSQFGRYIVFIVCIGSSSFNLISTCYCVSCFYFSSSIFYFSIFTFSDSSPLHFFREKSSQTPTLKTLHEIQWCRLCRPSSYYC